MILQLLLLTLAHIIPGVVGTPVDFSDRAKEKLVKRADFFAGRPSSPTIVWYPCYTGFQCAKLQVPFDYARPVSGDVFELAILKIPAQTTAPYKGTFFLTFQEDRPVDFASFAGLLYQTGSLAGYDIIAWDPRGNGYTTPTLQCFADQAAQDTYANYIRSTQYTPYGHFSGTFPPTDANIKANIASVSATMKQFSDGCAQYSSRILPFMGTVDNARDLNTIVKQLPAGRKLMLFYGYPTGIGLTYAALYPNGFDGMTLDGSINAQELFATGLNSVSTVQDGEKALGAFFDSCAAAGPCSLTTPFNDCPVGCYFWAPTAAAVKARYERLKAKYYFAPFKSVPPNSFCGDCTTTYGYIARAISAGMNFPADGLLFARHTSRQLLELETGTAIEGGSIQFYAQEFSPTFTFNTYRPILRCLDQFTAVPAIGLQAHQFLLNATSSQTGTDIASQEVLCSVSRSNIKLKNPYIGLFTAVTRGGMIFVTNTADPQQPTRNAKAMAARFLGSRVITVNQFGNTAFFSGFSACVQALLDNFTINNVLPSILGSFCNDVVQGAFGVNYQKDYRI